MPITSSAARMGDGAETPDIKRKRTSDYWQRNAITTLLEAKE